MWSLLGKETRVEEDEMRCATSSSEAEDKGTILPSSAFGYILALIGRDEALSEWGRQSAFPSYQFKGKAQAETSFQTQAEITFGLGIHGQSS